MTLVPDSSNVTVRICHANGSSKLKEVPFDRFLQVLQNSSVDIRSGTRMGFCPQLYDCIWAEPGTFRAVYVIEPQIGVVRYMADTYMVPFPRLCFMLEVQKGKPVKTEIFALRAGRVSDKSPLYHYPFGNVYGDGHICWGGNSLPTDITSVSDGLKLVSLFMSAPTNNDLWQRSFVKVEKLGREPLLSKIYSFLDGKKSFPESALASAGKTVGDLFK